MNPDCYLTFAMQTGKSYVVNEVLLAVLRENEHVGVGAPNEALVLQVSSNDIKDKVRQKMLIAVQKSRLN